MEFNILPSDIAIGGIFPYLPLRILYAMRKRSIEDNRNYEESLKRSSEIDIILLAIEADDADLMSMVLKDYQPNRDYFISDIFHLVCNSRSLNVLKVLLSFIDYDKRTIIIDTDLASILLNDNGFSQIIKDYIDHFIPLKKRGNLNKAISEYARDASLAMLNVSTDTNDIEVAFYNLCAGIFLLLSIGKNDDARQLIHEKNEVLKEDLYPIMEYGDIRSLYLFNTDEHPIDMSVRELYSIRNYSVKWYTLFLDRIQSPQLKTIGMGASMLNLISYLRQHM